MKQATLPLVTAALLLAPPSHGETMETVTVTGSRLPLTALSANSSLSREAIERINAPSTVALLRRVPNLLISQNGGPSGPAFASIRGSEPNFILVLIDGVPVNDPTNSSGGGFDFNQLDPALIERVEVYRGGISAIHGGEAISGVIHFITRQQASSSVTLEMGGDEQRRGNITLANPENGPYSALLSVAAAREEPSRFSEYDNQQVLLRLQAQGITIRHQLLFSASATDRESFAEDSGGSRLAKPRMPEARDSKQWLASWYSEHQANATQAWTARLSWSRHQEDSDHPGIRDGVLSGIPPSDIQSDYRKLDGELYHRWEPTVDWDLLAGVSAKHAQGENRGSLDYGFPVPVDFNLTQETYGLFAESSARFGATTVDFGARYDAPSGFGNEPSARLGFGHELTPTMRLFAAYSEGYKLPSFFALAHPLVGNPSLKPELSRNADIGVAIDGGTRYQLQVSLFHNHYEDLVDFDPALFLSVNRSEVTAKGAEWQGSVQLASWLVLNMDATYLDTDIKGTDSQLRRRPRWSGGLHLQAELGAVAVAISADSRGEFHDSSVATGPVILDGYTDVSLAAQWQPSEKIQLSLNLDNVTGERSESSVGFMEPRRRARLGIRFHL